MNQKSFHEENLALLWRNRERPENYAKYPAGNHPRTPPHPPSTTFVESGHEQCRENQDLIPVLIPTLQHRALFLCPFLYDGVESLLPVSKIDQLHGDAVFECCVYGARYGHLWGGLQAQVPGELRQAAVRELQEHPLLVAVAAVLQEAQERANPSPPEITLHPRKLLVLHFGISIPATGIQQQR